MVFIAILVITSPFWLDWLLYHDRMINPENRPVSKDATIIDVTVDPVGNSKTRRLKTVVFFSDGTQYVTHKSRDKMGLVSLHMTVDKEVLAEIFEDAVVAHDKLCSGIRSQPAYSATSPAEPQAPAPSVESRKKFTDPKPETTDPSPTIADPSAPAPATPKLRFCKLCGDPIDPATRKCNGCGKQYFRPPTFRKQYLFIGAGVLACVLVAVFIFNLTSRLNAAEAKVEELNAQIAALNTELTDQKDLVDKYAKAASSYSSDLGELQTQCSELRKENIALKNQLDRYERVVAIVGDTGAKIYHKLGCEYMEKKQGFYVYGIGYVMTEGYKPCPYCYG